MPECVCRKPENINNQSICWEELSPVFAECGAAGAGRPAYLHNLQIPAPAPD